MQVLVVPILAGVSGKAHVKPLTYFSALCALVGVGMLVEKGGVIMPNAGDFWSLASAIFFGVQVCFRTGNLSLQGLIHAGHQIRVLVQSSSCDDGARELRCVLSVFNAVLTVSLRPGIPHGNHQQAPGQGRDVAAHGLGAQHGGCHLSCGRRRNTPTGRDYCCSQAERTCPRHGFCQAESDVCPDCVRRVGCCCLRSVPQAIRL